MPQLQNVCPHGAWLSEEHAVQVLGLSSKSALKEAFHEGSLPHVFVEHGKRFDDVPHPFNKHRFFFVQNEGKSVNRPSIDFASWVGICKSLEAGKVDSLTPAAQAKIRNYTGYTDVEDAYPDLKRTHGIISSSELSGEDGEDGYRYGSNGGRQRSQSKGPSPSSNKAEGEVYTRADGKRVRRIKRSGSGHGLSGQEGSVAGTEAKDENSGTPKVRRIVRSNSSHGGSKDADSEAKDEKSDGQKVRRIRRSNSSHAGSLSKGGSLAGVVTNEKGDPHKGRRKIGRSSSTHSGLGRQGGSLSGFLAKDENTDLRPKFSGSRSVGAGEGEIYTRADGKKVRRVKKSSASSVNLPATEKKKTLSGFLDDGSKPKKKGSASVSGDRKTSLSGFLNDTTKGKKKGSASVSGDKKTSLSGFINDSSKSKKKGSASVSGDKKSSLSGFLNQGSKLNKRGSASVAGDQIAVSKESSLTGEIYVRADGKKVRRVKKSSVPSDENVEIITRPDGTKVRRIKKTKAKPKQVAGNSGSSVETPPTDSSTEASAGTSSDPSKKLNRSLSGFFDKSNGRKQFSGSNSIAGDQYAENEIYVRADGKKVRRVRKVKPSGDDSKSLAGFLDADASTKPKLNGAATVVGDTRGNNEGSDKPETEIYVRPDGKKVRRIRKTASKGAGNDLEKKEAAKKSLGGFLEKNEPSIKKKVGGSNSVAGDQIAISKEQSLTGEVYVRADGKKSATSKENARRSTSCICDILLGVWKRKCRDNYETRR